MTRGLVRCLLGLTVALTAAATQATQAAGAAQTGYTMTLAAAPAVVTEGTPLAMDVSITGVASPGTVQVTYSFWPDLSSRSAFAKSTSADPAGDPLQSITVPVQAVTGGFGAPISPVVTSSGRPSADRVVLHHDGVYPVTIVLHQQGDDAALATVRTYAVTHDQRPTERLSVAWVENLYVPPPARPLAEDEPDVPLQEALHTNGSLMTATQAFADAGFPLSVVPVPDTLARLQKAAQSDAAAAGALANVLRIPTRSELVAGPYALTQTVAWPLTGPQQVNAAFGYADATYDAVLQSHLPHDVQVAVGTDVPTGGVAALQAKGAAVVLFEPGAIATGSLRAAPTRPFHLNGLDGLRAILADRYLSADLTSVAASGPVAASQRFLADLTMLYSDSPAEARGIVVLPPNDFQPSAQLLSQVATRVGSAAYLHPVRLRDIAALPDLQVRRKPLTLSLTSPEPAASKDERQAYASIAAARTAYGQLAGMAVRPPATFAALDLTLVVASDATLVAKGDSLAYSRSVVLYVTSRLGAVDVPPGGQDYTLTSRQGDLPITIRNNSGLTLRARIELRGQSIAFPEGHTFDMMLVPGGVTQNVPVAVQSTGPYAVQLQLVTPDGKVVLRQTDIRVQSTAINGVALVLTFGSLGVLAVWWIRSARRRGRRARRGDRPTDLALGQASGRATQAQDEDAPPSEVPTPEPTRTS